MAAERIQRDGARVPTMDGPDLPIDDDDELPPITAEDIAHAVDRLEAGRESGLYDGFWMSDLYVIGHLTQLGRESYHAALRDPSQIPHLLASVVTSQR